MSENGGSENRESFYGALDRRRCCGGLARSRAQRPPGGRRARPCQSQSPTAAAQAPAKADRGHGNTGEARLCHRGRDRHGAARQARRRAHAAGLDEQDHDRLCRLRHAEAGPRQARGRIAGQRAGLAAAGVEDVRADRRAHQDRRSAEGRDHPVRQRCLPRPRRRPRRERGSLCRADEPEGEGDRAQGQPFRQCRRSAQPRPLDDRARSGDLVDPDDQGLSGVLSLLQ